MKSLFKKVSVLILSVLNCTSCSLLSSKKVDIYLENNFKIVREYVNGYEVQLGDMLLPKYYSNIYIHENSSYEMVLKFKDDYVQEISGTYHLSANDDGKSGEGFFECDGKKIEMSFENHYYLVFTLPDWLYNSDGKEHLLYFEKWIYA